MTKKQLKEAEEALETILKRDKEMVAMACKTALVLKVYSSIALEA